MGKLIGVDIGGTKCAIVLGNKKGEIIKRNEFKTEIQKGKDYTINKIIQGIEKLLINHDNSIECIGISCGGPLDYKRGVILSPPNLPGWEKVPITKIISEKFGIKTFLENDANASVLAEWKFGAGKGYDNIIFLTFGTGIGAGLILNGQLYRGSNGLAGEVGHIRLAENGPVGHGKSGSFEGFCSGGGISKLARYRIKTNENKENILSDFDKKINQITAKDIGISATNGDVFSKSLLAESGSYLGKGLSILIDILNPEMIIIGGIYMRCQQFLEPEAKKIIRKEALPKSYKKCKIVPAKLGEKIGDYASLSVAIFQNDI